MVFESFLRVPGASRRGPEASWGVWEASWGVLGRLGTILGRLGGVLGRSYEVLVRKLAKPPVLFFRVENDKFGLLDDKYLRPYQLLATALALACRDPGTSWGDLGASWRRLGGVLGRS